MENETLSLSLSLLWKFGSFFFFYPSKGSVPTIAILTNAPSRLSQSSNDFLFFLFISHPQLFLIGLDYHPSSLSTNLLPGVLPRGPISYLPLSPSVVLPSGEEVQ